MRGTWIYLGAMLSFVSFLGCAGGKVSWREPGAGELNKEILFSQAKVGEYRRLLVERREGSIHFRIFLCGDLMMFQDRLLLSPWFACAVENVGDDAITVFPPVPIGALWADLLLDGRDVRRVHWCMRPIHYFKPVVLAPGSGVLVDKIAPWILDWSDAVYFPEKPKEYLVRYTYTYEYHPARLDEDGESRGFSGEVSMQDLFPSWVFDVLLPPLDLEFPQVILYRRGERFKPEDFGIDN